MCSLVCVPLLLLPSDSGHELAAEGGDVCDHAAPDEVALAKRRFVHPGRAGVLEVVLDAQRARSPRAIDYAGGDRAG